MIAGLSDCPAWARGEGVLVEDSVVKHQWQIELGERRVETLKSVSGITLKQEYIELLQNSPDGKPVPDLVLGGPEFFGTLTLTRGLDKSEKFTQWILDSKDPARKEASSPTLVLAYVNEQNNKVVKRFQIEGARLTSWSAADLSAGDSSAVEETLELAYLSANPI
ncbi:phage tail protein [Streptomyces sp. NBC_01232]|uniref:phage tail protein n=1 Tax=Streptomyces sp. NBC_01232 TaxID=2903786 RepID=UPI002E167C7B|nr:phage tail protein [Streptomyces sp. NBC_01232]